MDDNTHRIIEETIKRSGADAIHGVLGALADSQAKLITMLLEQGVITPLAAQQTINELRNKSYQQPPLSGAEEFRREAVKWIADHLQESVEWNRAATGRA